MQRVIQFHSRAGQYKITIDQTDVLLEIDNHEGILMQHVLKDNPKQWLSEQAQQTYKITKKNTGWHFQQKLLLSEVDHSPLQQEIKDQIKRYNICSVKYDKILEKQIDCLLKQMLQHSEILHWQHIDKNNINTIQILCLRSYAQIIDSKLQQLKLFKQCTLIYPLENYFSTCKLKTQNQQDLFIQGLLRHLSSHIKNTVNKKLKRFQIQHNLIIRSMHPFIDRFKKKKNKQAPKIGIAFQVIGFQSCFGLFYQTLEKWLLKLNWIILQVSEIKCCKKQHIQKWILQHKNIKAVLLSPYKNISQRIVVFAPKRDKQDLEKQLQRGTHIVTGRQFNELDFKIICKYSSEFRRYISAGKAMDYNVQIYPQYILVDCDDHRLSIFKKRIGEFLQLYKEEQKQVRQFKSKFHINIFSQFYVDLIKCKPITYCYDKQKQKLFRINSKNIQADAQNEISQIFKIMKKELVYKPLMKKIANKDDLFQITPAPVSWRTIECLQNKRFKLTQKIDIHLKSYGSITNSDSQGIFVVHQLKRCQELLQILKQEEVSYKFQQNLMKNKILTKPLKYCKYFQSITMWVVSHQSSRQRRNKFDQTRLNLQIQNLIKNNSSKMHFKIVFPTQSQQIIQLVLPNLLNHLMESCKYQNQIHLDLTIYTSCNGGKSMRSKIIEQFRRYGKEHKVQRVSQLELSIDDIEKITQYKYLELKYFQNQITKSASPLNSFIFHRQLLKKGNTPICLPESQKYNQYLVCFFSLQIFLIKGSKILKQKQKLSAFPELHEYLLLIKTKFAKIDYIVIYGHLQRGKFSRRLFFTSDTERMYKRFQELQCNVKQKKILSLNNSVEIKYDRVFNEYLQLFRVQTHKSMIDKLQKLKYQINLH